jgi:hypothetical protein
MVDYLRYVRLRAMNALRMVGNGDFRRLGQVMFIELTDRFRNVESSAYRDPTRMDRSRTRPTALKRVPPPDLRGDRDQIAAGIERIRSDIEIDDEIKQVERR